MKYFQHIIRKNRFNTLRNEFADTYDSLKELGDEPFVLPFWANVNTQVEEVFLPRPDTDFLNVRAIKDTMFVAGSDEWLQTQITYLKKKLGDSYRNITSEDPLGKPALLPAPNSHTSHNTLHHLYHIYFFLEQTKLKLSDVESVVEWGGGYGNFAKLWYRLDKGQSTYTIIDTALFCSIQWLYLTAVLGPDSVHLLRSKDDQIQEGKINLVPLALLDSVSIKGDLFVSTWGLSESAKEAQDYVVKKKWFKAKHLLIGFQDSTKELYNASRLGQIAKKDGAKIIDIEFIPNNHYAIK